VEPRTEKDTIWSRNRCTLVGSTLFLHGICMLRECIYSDCAHEQHVRRTLSLTLTLTHTITAYSVNGNIIRAHILVCATRQKPCRKRVYRTLELLKLVQYFYIYMYVRHIHNDTFWGHGLFSEDGNTVHSYNFSDTTSCNVYRVHQQTECEPVVTWRCGYDNYSLRKTHHSEDFTSVMPKIGSRTLASLLSHHHHFEKEDSDSGPKPGIQGTPTPTPHHRGLP